MKLYLQFSVKVFYVLFSIVFFSYQSVAQVPTCATSIVPVNGGTLINPATPITWTAPVGGATGYRVYVGTDGGGVTTPTNIVNAANVTTTTYTFSNAVTLNCATTYYLQIIPYRNPGNLTAVGCAIQTFTINAAGDPTVFPINSWNAYCFNSTNWTNYTGYYTEAGQDFDSRTVWTNSLSPSRPTGGAATYQGCTVPDNNHSISYKREGFTPATYSLNIVHDDACAIFLNGVQIYTRSGSTGSFINSVWTGNLDASSQIEFRWTEGSGSSHGGITFVPIVTPTLVAGTIGTNQSLCFGNTDPAAFTSIVAGSGSCSSPVVYQWQSDVNCTGTFTDIVGATGAIYDAPLGVTQTTCYRRMVIDNNCARSLASNTVTVTVYATPPGDPSIVPVNSWTGYVYGFASYSSADNGWTDYRGYFNYTGPSDPSFNTSTIYTVANVPSSAPGYLGCSVNANLSGIQMKRQGFTPGTYQIDFSSDDAGYLYINGSLVYSRTSNGSATNVWTGNLDASSIIDFHYKNNTSTALGALTFTLIPTPTLVAGTITGDQILCSGNDPKPFVSTQAASGTCGAVAYQWQEDVNCTGTFTNIVGANAAIYDVPAGITQTTCYRRAILDPNCGRIDYTNTVTVTIAVTPPGDPSVFPLNVWNGYVYDFSSIGYGGGADVGWTDYKGYFSTNTVSFNTTTLYNAGSSPSNAPNYAGCQIATAPLTGVQMKRQGFPTGTYQIDFSSDDAGYLYVNGLLVYSRTGNGSATNVWTGNLDASSTIDYRYKNNGGQGSGVLTLTLVVPTIPLNEGGIALTGPAVVCPGDIPSPIASTVDATSSCYLIYQWQSDDGTGYVDIVGANGTTYAPSVITVPTSFRRKVSDACGDVAYSNVVDINVGPSSPPDPSIYGANSWIAYVYNQQNYVLASLYGSYTDPGISASDPSFNSLNSWANLSAPSMAATYTGCQVGVDNHSVSYKRQGFPAGTYTLNVLNDDGCQLYVDGVLVYSRGSWTPTFVNGVWTGVLGASSQVEFRWTEGGGGSNGAVTFVLVPTPGPLDGGVIDNAKTQVCSGDAAPAFTSTTLPSNGCAVASYQWQLDTGSGYTNIAGATGVTYNPIAQTVSTSYRRQVTDACSQVAYSNIFTITVASPVLPNPTVFGSNVWNVYAYSDLTFTSYTGSYVDNGFSASDPSFDSRNIWSTTTPSNASGYIGCDITPGSPMSVIYKRQGFPVGIYRLDYNSDDAGSVYIDGVLVYTSISWGTLFSNIWTGPLNASSTIEYRWNNSGGGPTYGQLSMVHPITPTALLPGSIANVSSIVCSGNAPQAFTSTANASGGCYKTYQWQSSTTAPGTAGYTDIVGANAATFAPTAITVNTYYRRKVTDACGTIVYSNVVLVTVGVPSPPTVTWGNGVWNAYVYNGRNFTTLFGQYPQSNTSASNYSFDTRNAWATTTNASTAPGYTGCTVGNDLFSVSFRQTNFVAGTYQINMQADDDAVVIIDGVTVYNGINVCCTNIINVWTGTLNASSQVEIRYGENAGNAFCNATFQSSTPPALVAGTIGGDQTICSNVVPSTLTSVADATSGCTITYQWQYSTTSATGPWSNIGGNSSTYTATPPGLTQTRYYIRNATDACGRSASSNVVTVTVDPKPNNAGVITGLASVCSGQAGVTYTIAPVLYATSYDWVLPTGASITSGLGTNSITVTFGSSSGNVVVEPVNACGQGLTRTLAVTVTPTIPAPASPITGPSSVCQAQFNVLYSVPAVPNASSYIWTIPSGSTIVSGANTRSIRITFGAVDGVISVTPTNSCGDAISATTLAVTVNPTPSAAGLITGTGTACPGQTGVVYSIAPVANTTSYNWSLPAGSIITAGAGTNSITVTFGSTSGNVTVTPTNSCGNGTSRNRLVSVVALGTTGAISGPSPVCQNSTVVYSVTTVTGASNYNWTVPAGATITAGNGTRTITVTMGVTSGDVSVTASNACSPGTAVARTITVTNSIPNPADPIIGVTEVCPNEMGVSYSVTPVPGATTYTWSVPTGASIVSGAGTEAIVVDFGTSPGNVRVRPSNVCGIAVTATSQAVAIKPLPAAVGVISGPTSICKGEINVVYSISPVANALTYSWSVPTGAVITSGDGTTSILVSYTNVSVTSGNVTVDATNTCSTTSRSLPITISLTCPNTWIGVTSVDWNTASNWNIGVIPTSTSNVIIPSGTPFAPSVIAGTTANALGLTINSAANLNVASTGVLNIYGNVLNNGSVTTITGSTIQFVGSSSQTTTGLASIHNVAINNTAGVALLTSTTVNGTLSLLNGVLTTNDTLTINFDNGGNIGYAATDNGSIVGNVKGRRDVIAKTHYIATPFNGSTSLQVAKTTPLWVSPYWKMYTRAFSTQNWSAVIDTTTAMPLGTGFSLSVPTPAPLILKGAYDHNYTLTGSSYSNVVAAKYILVGNPYPSTLDWDNGAGWTKTNVGDAIYFWDAANQRTASYVGGVGTNGGTQFVPAMQSFLVATTGVGGANSSVSINNDARSSATQSYWRVANNDQLVKLSVKSSTGMMDETVVRFDELTSNAFETDVDAYKVMNSFVPSLYTKTLADATDYSINTLPMEGRTTVIPLNLKVPSDGVYQLNCTKYSVLGYNMLLEDKLEGTITPMQESSIFVINAKRTDSTNRFVLRFAENLTTNTSNLNNKTVQVSSFEGNMMLSLDGIVANVTTIEVYSSIGAKVQVIENQKLNSGVTIVPLDKALASGVYVVKFALGNDYYTGKIVIK